MSKRNRRKQQIESLATHALELEKCSYMPMLESRDEEIPVSSSAPLDTSGRWWHACLVVLLLGLSAGLYSWTADFPMVFDDHTYMMDNPLFPDADSFKYFQNFEEFANRPEKLGSDPDFAVNFILRPVAYASFYLNYVFDGFNPRWFRVGNIVIHALNGILIYALIHLLLRRSSAAESGMLQRQSVFFIPATTALLFVAHPLATESVTYIIQRFTSMVVLFSLLALWLQFLSLSARTRAARWTLGTGAVVAMVLAMQTKESSVVVPFLAVLMDWLVLGSRLRTALWRGLPLLLCAPIIPLLVLLTATAQNGGHFDLGTSFNLVNSRDMPFNHWHYIVTQLTVVAHYLKLMFWPSGMNLDPEWPKYETLWRGPVLIAFGVLTGLLASAWWLFRRHRQDVRFSLGFAFTVWFFISVSISSGVVPLPDLMAEHRSYMPSIGIFALVACLMDWVRTAEFRQRLGRILVPTAAVVFVVALSWATCARNEVWRTNESLWKDTVAKSPGKFRTWGNLGTAYSLTGNEEKAVVCYRKALEIEPRFQNGLLNLSNSLLRLNRPKESLKTTMKLLKLDETAGAKVPVAFTMGLGLAGVGRYDEAVSIFRNIIQTVPDDPSAHTALGVVYYETGLPHRALEHYRLAATMQPNDENLKKLIKAAEIAMSGRNGRP